jgi:hypothetical protein
MKKRAIALTLVLAASGFASACASSGDEVCRDRGNVVVCHDVPTGAVVERCHRNWRGVLVCRGA